MPVGDDLIKTGSGMVGCGCAIMMLPIVGMCLLVLWAVITS